MKKNLKLPLICSSFIACLPITCISAVSCSQGTRYMYIYEKNKGAKHTYYVGDYGVFYCEDKKTRELLDVFWFSLDWEVLSIDPKEGFYRCSKEGETWISARLDGYYEASFKITVLPKED